LLPAAQLALAPARVRRLYNGIDGAIRARPTPCRRPRAIR
jgi:hypothetical protein